jgi:hypothetical protein
MSMALVLDKAQIEDAILAQLAEAPIADSIDFAASKNFDHSVRNTQPRSPSCSSSSHRFQSTQCPYMQLTHVPFFAAMI